LEKGKGTAQNRREAVKYYELSADQGNASGQYRRGLCLEEGSGTAPNLAAAARYYIRLSPIKETLVRTAHCAGTSRLHCFKRAL
jgi:hypothetical protein